MRVSFLFFAFLALNPAALAQADIQKPCAVRSHMLSDGRIQITDCRGKISLVDPSGSLGESRAASSQKPNEHGSSEHAPQATAASRSEDPGQAYAQWEIANLEYEQRQLQRDERVFAWQDTSTKVIFSTVMLIVLAGLGIACFQFREAAQTEVGVGKEGFILKTSLVGVVILFMSMGFLYLYLFFVYPVKSIGQ